MKNSAKLVFLLSAKENELKHRPDEQGFSLTKGNNSRKMDQKRRKYYLSDWY